MIPPINPQNFNDTVPSYLQQLKNGCLLLSHEDLQDPNFTVTIVLICVYNSNDGAFGLVCNRPSHMPLSEVFEVDSIVAQEQRRIYIGGPVQQETLHVIQLTDTPASASFCVAPQVYLGGEWESLESILAQDPGSTRLFLGYSGWSPGQLETEIAEGAWEVYRVDLKKFLSQWKEPLFNDIAKIRVYLNEIASQQA